MPFDCIPKLSLPKTPINCHCCEREVKSEEIVTGDLGHYCSDGCLEEYEADSFFDNCLDDY